MDAEQESNLDAPIEVTTAGAIGRFEAERVASYLLERPSLAAPAFFCLEKAEAVLVSDPVQAQALATSAMKYAVMELFFTPIIQGMLYDDQAADSFVEEQVEGLGLENFHHLLLQVLEEHAGVDLSGGLRAGSSDPLWHEIQTLFWDPAPEQAQLAIEVAHHLLWVQLRPFLAHFGLVLPLLSQESSAGRCDDPDREWNNGPGSALRGPIEDRV